MHHIGGTFRIQIYEGDGAASGSVAAIAPSADVDLMRAEVCAHFANHPWHVAVLKEKQVSFGPDVHLDVSLLHKSGFGSREEYAGNGLRAAVFPVHSARKQVRVVD